MVKNAGESTQFEHNLRGGAGHRILRGNPYPLGATWDGAGVNVAVYSHHADAVRLLLFDSEDAREPAATLELTERSGAIWHGYVPGIGPGQLYGFRVEGPYRPGEGHRFNANKVLLDPYARTIGRSLVWDDSLYGYERGHADGDLSFNSQDSAPFAPLGAVVSDAFDWRGVASPSIPWEETVIYETHVKGISQQHPDVPESIRGTYLGLAAEPVTDHLRRLGVTSIQLLPVHASVQDERLVSQGLAQYWGYNTLSFFAPETGYASRGPASAVHEFKTMVRALHEAGFEVLLDVVYNHTGEGNHLGPTLSFRGFDNKIYYKERPDNRRFLVDYTGTGNTMDAGQSAVVRLIMDSLRYWVTEMHVDGFRFDLASALSRERFDVNMQAAFFQILHQDPVLSGVKLIAEPWDLGPSGYQLGAFPWQWSEWNDRYRDAVRRFWRGDRNMAGEFATRLAGSSDLYRKHGRSPTASINYVTCHDGFTAEDLVSFTRKRNQANLEDGRDGSNANHSMNAGVEGLVADAAILARRDLLKRSMLATLMVSQGVPMLLGGDELCRTQRGNNNAYCQDNETSWYHWDLDERQQDFLSYVQRLIAFRRKHSSLRRTRHMTGNVDNSGAKDGLWWHTEGREMTSEDWTHATGQSFGLLLCADQLQERHAQGQSHDDTLLILCNGGAEDQRFILPAGRWEIALRSGAGGALAVTQHVDVVAGEMVLLTVR